MPKIGNALPPASEMQRQNDFSWVFFLSFLILPERKIPTGNKILEMLILAFNIIRQAEISSKSKKMF